jgi:hypothetical protein
MQHFLSVNQAANLSGVEDFIIRSRIKSGHVKPSGIVGDDMYLFLPADIRQIQKHAAPRKAGRKKQGSER